MVLDYRLKEEFLEEFAKRKRHFLVSKLGTSDNHEHINIVKKNIELIKNFNALSSLEKRQKLETKQQALIDARQRKQSQDEGLFKHRIL